MKKKILIIATGGTIACKKTIDGLSPGVTSEELLKYVSDFKNNCEIDTMQILNIDSTNIQPEHWEMMTAAIEEKYPLYDGFVITHGTDTMAYTAAALSYLIQNVDKPIVITGSQKPINSDITDAKRNLNDSIRFACEGSNGVYIVFNGKAIIGTRAKKTKTKSYDAFESINFPYVAFIDNFRITQYIREDKPLEKPIFCKKVYPNIFLLKLSPGMKPDVLDYISDEYEGIVIESYGTGGIPFEDRRNFLEKLDAITKKGKIVIISTQVMHEGSDLGIYEVGTKVMKNPILQSYDMTVEAAITKLMWIMGKTKKYDEVEKMFYTKIHEDILYNK